MAALFWIIVALVLILTGAIVPVLVIGGWVLVAVLVIVLIASIVGATFRGVFSILADMIEFFVGGAVDLFRPPKTDRIMPAGKETDEADAKWLAEQLSRPPSAAEIRAEKRMERIRAQSWRQALGRDN
jgi:hypothetical protein